MQKTFIKSHYQIFWIHSYTYYIILQPPIGPCHIGLLSVGIAGFDLENTSVMRGALESLGLDAVGEPCVDSTNSCFGGIQSHTDDAHWTVARWVNWEGNREEKQESEKENRMKPRTKRERLK